MNIEKLLIKNAKKLNKTIVFPEASFSERIVLACKQMIKSNMVKIVLIGSLNDYADKFTQKELDKISFYNSSSDCYNNLINLVYEKRKHKGVSKNDAKELLNDPIYFAVALLEYGLCDGMVCGAEVSTAKTLKPALQIVKSKQGLVASYFLFVGKNRVTDDVFLMSDCAVVENPTDEQLTLISNMLLEENSKLDYVKNPRVAFLSYSTTSSAVSESTIKVQNAFKKFKEQNPNIMAVGEVQFDASIKQSVAKTKIKGQEFTTPANMFIMPNIDAGNICYKATQYFGGLKAIGPITLGFNKPVNDLSRGCNVKEIILLTAITVLQSKS